MADAAQVPALARAYDYQSFTDSPVAPEPSGEWLHPFEVSSGVPDRLVESARGEARATGYAVGWSQGMRDAYAQMASEAERIRERAEELERNRATAVLRALGALDQAAADLESRAVPSIAHLEETVIEMAVNIAQAVLGHELRRRSDRVIIQAMARILALVPSNEAVTVRLSAQDHAALAAHEVIDSLDSTRRISIVAAAELEPGDVVATCGATQIDARIEPALARIREVLRTDDDGTELVDRRAS